MLFFFDLHRFLSSSRIKPLGECVVFKNSDKGEGDRLLIRGELHCLVFFFFIQETHVEIRESVRSKDVFIIQTGSTK